jgi:hypothetical protein
LRALALVCRPAFCRSSVHLPVPLGSTVITRFAATTGTLTPARLLPAPGQVSLITECAFPDIPSPTTPCAPVSRQCSWLRVGLASDSPWGLSAVLRTSLFARSLVSRIRPYRVCVAGHFGPSVLRTVLSFPVALHALSPGRSYFHLVAGSTATEGLPPSYARSFSSARAPIFNRLSVSSRP